MNHVNRDLIEQVVVSQIKTDKIERVRTMNDISSHIDRACDCIKRGESMFGDFNIKPIDKGFYKYYHYKTYNIKFFIGTLAELESKLTK